MSVFSRPPRPDDPVATAEQMRAVDARTIESVGIPGAVLMENAGRACANRLEDLAATGRLERHALVVCGPGNNGGDGLVIARTLEALGWQVEAWFAAALEPRERCGADLALQLAVAEALDRSPRAVAGVAAERAFESACRAVANAGGAVVDALFGTGLGRPIEGRMALLLDAVAASGADVLAVDVPSGLCADTGRVLGTAAPARWTTTLAGLKPGLFAGRGPELVGELELAQIGIPSACLAHLPRLGDTHDGR